MLNLSPRVFIDDIDLTGKMGGDAYSSLGISLEGAIILIRPDGYTGIVVPLSSGGLDALVQYFSTFMVTCVIRTSAFFV